MSRSRSNIKLPNDEYERHNDRRKANNQTWAEYIDGQAPDETAGLDESEVRMVVRDELRRFKDDLLTELRG